MTKPPAPPRPATPRQQAAARRARVAVLIAAGLTYRQIAEIEGCTRNAAKTLGADPRVQELVALESKRLAERARGSVEKGRDIIKAAIPRAAQRLANLALSTDERVALRAATALMDRGGLGAKQEVKLTSGLDDATEAELWAALEDAKRRMAEEAEDDAAGGGHDPLDDDEDDEA